MAGYTLGGKRFAYTKRDVTTKIVAPLFTKGRLWQIAGQIRELLAGLYLVVVVSRLVIVIAFSLACRAVINSVFCHFFKFRTTSC